MSVCQVEVRPVTIAGMTGFQIGCLWRADSDSFWAPLVHAAVFRDPDRAERFLARVKTKMEWNWDWSQWGVSPTALLSKLDYVQEHAPVYSVL